MEKRCPECNRPMQFSHCTNCNLLKNISYIGEIVKQVMKDAEERQRNENPN